MFSDSSEHLAVSLNRYENAAIDAKNPFGGWNLNNILDISTNRNLALCTGCNIEVDWHR